MFERLLLLWLVIGSAIAYFWPEQWVLDPFVASKPLLSWIFASTMFSIGLMLPDDEVRAVYRRWPAVLGGTCVQYATMPLLAFLVALVWGLEGFDRIGLIMVGCVPGAMASNVLTMQARGNTSYSVSLTTSATLFSPLVVPFALKFALGEEVALDTLKVFRGLMLTVVLPVTVGYALQRLEPAIRPAARRWAPLFANATILWIIAVVVGLNRANLAQSTLGVLVPLLVVNGCGYLLGYGAGWLMRLPEPMRRAVTLEVGMQNAGLGSLLAANLFDDQAALAPAVYTFLCMLTGSMLAQAWFMRDDMVAKKPKSDPASDAPSKP